jgi:hypothetical protein
MATALMLEHHMPSREGTQYSDALATKADLTAKNLII